jgi:PAS domain S-box-containing protein
VATGALDLNAYMRSIVDALPDAVTVQDASGRLVYANQRAADVVGFASPEAMIEAGGDAAIEGWTTTYEDGRQLVPDELPGRRALRGEEPEPVVLRAVHLATGRLQWTRVRSVPIHADDGSVAYAVNLMEDMTDVKLLEVRQRVLAQAGELLSGTPDLERTLQQVASLAVPEVAQWCAFDVPDGRGGTRQVALAHADPEKIALARMLRARYPPDIDPERGVGKALAGASDHYPDIPDELLEQGARDAEHLAILREIGMRSAIVVPVRAGAEVFGALTLVDGARSLTKADVELAEDLGRRAGQAITTARLFEQRTEVANILQAALLPPELPDIPGWDLASLFTPSTGTEIGGDFFDLFFARDSWWLVIGDVCGRGAPAAALTSMVRYSLRSAAQLSDDPVVATEQVNRTLTEHGDLSLCTLAVLRVGRTGGVEILCAGHPPAALVGPGGVEWVGRPGPMLGAYEDGTWASEPLDVRAGDAVVLYTDGVLDMRGEAGRFERERLAATLSGAAGGDARALLDTLGRELAGYSNRSTEDDAAAVCARRLS